MTTMKPEVIANILGGEVIAEPEELTVTGTEARVCEMIAARQQFGRWTLLTEVSAGRHPKWRAVCECGKEKIVDLGNVKSGKSNSCGCLRSELSSARLTTHGQNDTRCTGCQWKK